MKFMILPAASSWNTDNFRFWGAAQRKSMSVKRVFLSSLCPLLFAGCTSIYASKYNTSFENVVPLRNESLRKIAVDDVRTDPSKQKSVENLSIRLNSFRSPYGNFAAYLREALMQELGDARILDQKSSTRLTATIMKNEFSCGTAAGSAALAARFVVTNGKENLFDKVKEADIKWDSAFAANSAAPLAQTKYSDVYKRLLQTIFADIDFLNALRKKD